MSGNKLAGKHALGNRARKSGQGILTVRFEMPFAIWCTTCPTETIIGQGVRFNAEKKKIGNYFSSPIYSFRMKHTACGGWIEIKTDPKTTTYIVVDGARKRETGEDQVREGDIVLRSEEEKEKLRNDAFAALEVTIEGRQQDKANGHRINELLGATDRDWDDPYAVNKRLRNGFRTGRKQREKDHVVAEDIKDKFSLDVDLLPENEEDARRAAYVDFGIQDDSPETAIRRAESKELFSRDKLLPTKNNAGKRMAKNDARAIKQQLQAEIGHNTRAVMDPFMSPRSSSKAPLVRVKRKREVTESNPDTTVINASAPPLSIPKGTLVDYDSD